jgi:hypothetical protein
MRDDEMKEEAPPSPMALLNWISERSVALLIEPAEGGMYVGSATAIEVAGRYFLATAAHNLDGVSQVGQMRALPGGRRLERPLRLLGWNVRKVEAGGELDVAWIEVDVVSVVASSLRALSISSLRCQASHLPDTAFFVQGYPEGAVDRNDWVERTPLLTSIGQATSSLPAGASSLPYQDSIDLLVEWPASDLGPLESKLPRPAGVSGGGVWILPRFAHNPGWTYSELRLAGIARAWRPGSRQLLATRIEHWLKLLADDKAYARAEIAAALSSS